ncbi:hypothetical protein B0T21DRAFT_256147, partial [Apiosordaria backusii]
AAPAPAEERERAFSESEDDVWMRSGDMYIRNEDDYWYSDYDYDDSDSDNGVHWSDDHHEEEFFGGFGSDSDLPEVTSSFQLNLTIERIDDDTPYLMFHMIIAEGPLTGVESSFSSRDRNIGESVRSLMPRFADRYLRPGQESTTLRATAPVICPRLQALYDLHPPDRERLRFGLQHSTVVEALGGFPNFYTWQETMLFYILYRVGGDIFLTMEELIPAPTDVRPEELPSILRQTDEHPTGAATPNSTDDPDAPDGHKTRKLSPQQAAINDLDIRKVASDENLRCIICFEDFAPGEEEAKIKVCSHGEFHKECLATWLRKDLTCPYCRAELGKRAEGAGNRMEDEVDPDAWLGRDPAPLERLLWRR